MFDEDSVKNMAGIFEYVAELIKKLNDCEDLFKQVAILIKNTTNALESEGFTREEAVSIAIQMSSNIKSR